MIATPAISLTITPPTIPAKRVNNPKAMMSSAAVFEIGLALTDTSLLGWDAP